MKAWILALAFLVPLNGREDPKGFLEGECGRGSLKREGALWVLRVSGTPAEIGTQEGSLLSGPIRALVQGYLPRLIGEGALRTEALRKARRMEPHIPERFRAEMRAAAEAAGVAYEDLLLANLLVELKDVMQCSVAVVDPGSAEGKETLVGRNLDWLPGGRLEEAGFVAVVSPEKGRRFVSMTYPCLLGVVTGLNQDGLAVANLVVSRGKDRPIAGIPYPFLLRSLLEEAGDRPQAMEALAKAQLTVPQNLMVADRAGGAIVECAPDALRERAPAEGVSVATNAFREDTDEKERCDRFRVLSGACGKRPVGADRLEKGLRAAAIPSMNLQCCLFRLGTMKARVSICGLPASEARLQDVDLGGWLKP